MRKLKEKVNNLVTTKADLEAEVISLSARIFSLEKEKLSLKIQANKVGPLISENVALSNKLDDLKEQIQQLTDEL